jgi:hypothetical protein
VEKQLRARIAVQHRDGRAPRAGKAAQPVMQGNTIRRR